MIRQYATASAACVLILCCGVCAPSALANYNVHAEGNAFITVSTTPNQGFAFDQTNGARSYSNMISDDTPGEHAELIVNARFGEQHGRIATTSSSFSDASAYLFVRMTDRITVNNPGGGLVHLRFDLPVSGNIVFSNAPTTASAIAGLSVDFFLISRYENSFNGLSHTQEFPVPFEADVSSGTSFDLQQTLFLQAIPNGAGKIEVDYSNTSLARITVETPGANFTTDSGATYGNVPEPSTAATLTGLLLVSIRRRRINMGPLSTGIFTEAARPSAAQMSGRA
jgi:hypothetical protein